ncbi:hypothetical protein BATDEDRAFT_25701 [Batrachochytrium dendrobatidis JAM81]|uniref:Carboxypeptidase M14A n=2 Tax=Batrachochytrium dendrobatidis TaxID=109871 RepID=F4P5C4_BATDJ|nr:uncharacterized protein BATDEDRAFT_25701 [Batrachochytrium dendrobatidis JAM81]EGF79390.1 hypothetical protein BATDEDRAFT_25701 [Batrachochytrium dendrobatidis JAM81]|eukprot:XP_006679854.1 hypothetical protein BATDEDRAFT_25701 [Batrachochytrium dendrobatidis JAM81]
MKLQLPTFQYFLVFAATVFSTVNAKYLRFDNHQLWRVMPTTPAHSTIIFDLQESNVIDVWSTKSQGGMILMRVPPTSIDAVKTLLDNSGISHTLVVPSVQDLIDQEKQEFIPMDTTLNEFTADFTRVQHEQQQVLGLPENTVSSDMSDSLLSASFFNKYHTIDELHEYYRALAKTYPDLVETFSIGKTYQGRDILGVHIHAKHSVNRVAEPKEIVFHGGMHAREWIAPAVVTFMATQLVEQYNKNTDVTTMLDTFIYSIIPVLNIDGFVYTHKKDRMWRKTRQPNRFACVGTDPNRNWEYAWGTGGSSSNPCSEAYMGPKPFSEPEPRQMAAYVQSRAPNVISYIDFHAFSQLWMYPFGNICNHPAPDSAKLMRVGKAAVGALKSVHGTSFQVGPICDIIYQASGSSVDHIYARANVTFSYAVELRDTGNYGFILPPKYIIPSGQETFAGIIAMSLQIIKEISNQVL